MSENEISFTVDSLKYATALQTKIDALERFNSRLREERDRYRKFAEYVSLYSNDPAICVEAHKLLSGSEGEK